MDEANNDTVEKVMYETISQHLGVSREDLGDTTSVSSDPGTFYRIIADIKQALETGATEDDWSFDEGNIDGLVSYYSKLVDGRAD